MNGGGKGDGDESQPIIYTSLNHIINRTLNWLKWRASEKRVNRGRLNEILRDIREERGRGRETGSEIEAERNFVQRKRREAI